jgi:hypothetical protein
MHSFFGCWGGIQEEPKTLQKGGRRPLEVLGLPGPPQEMQKNIQNDFLGSFFISV